MRKKIFTIIFALLIIMNMSVMISGVSADTVTENATEESAKTFSEVITDSATPPVSNEAVEPNDEVAEETGGLPPEGEKDTDGAYVQITEPTFFSRLHEAWENGDIMDVVVIVWGVVSTIFMFVLKNADKVNSIAVRADINKNTATSNAKINELIATTNSVETEAKKLSEQVSKVLPEVNKSLDGVKLADDEKIKELSSKVDSCGKAVVAFATMMQTIYSNSKTLPQPTKDVVNANYVSVLNAFQKETVENQNAEQ